MHLYEPLAGAVFAAAALVCFVSAFLMAWRALQLEDALHVAFAVMLLGLGVALVYETFAVWTELEPTISRLTSLLFLRDPVLWLLFYAGACLLGGALAEHFTALGRHTHWTIPLLGVVMFTAGAVVSRLTGWLP
jgi:hypothetical protein